MLPEQHWDADEAPLVFSMQALHLPLTQRLPQQSELSLHG
jgi:hypothetical protein